MVDPVTFLHRLKILFVGVFIIAIFALLTFLLSAEPINAEAAEPAKQSKTVARQVDGTESPNIVTSGFMNLAHELDVAVDTTAQALNSGARTVASATSRTAKSAAKAIGNGAAAAGRTAGKGATTVGRATGNGVVAVLSVPGNVVEFVTEATPLHGIIRPSEHVDVPIIDPNSPELAAAIAALPPEEKPASKNKGPVWPIHGQVTTEFGVAHWPFQPTHTGMDISDGKAPGTTPIKPFRPGKVIETIHSYYGLGNHVIVDHGSGVTSVYAHLNSISVKVGQAVDLDTVLGMEGTTGLSTGTHLHFEVRVNGQAADPRRFVSGQP